MSSSESSFGGRRPRGSKSTSRTKRTTNTASTRSTGPYDRDFQQNLIDGGMLVVEMRHVVRDPDVTE
jgi:hypothetical protein